jgi:hypothetical protein
VQHHQSNHFQGIVVTMVHSAMFFRVLAFVALLVSASQVRKKCMELVHCVVSPESNEFLTVAMMTNVY